MTLPARSLTNALDLIHILTLSPPQISLGLTRDTQTSPTEHTDGQVASLRTSAL